MEHLKFFEKQCKENTISYGNQFKGIQEQKNKMLCDEYWASLSKKVQKEVYEILKELQNEVLVRNADNFYK